MHEFFYENTHRTGVKKSHLGSVGTVTWYWYNHLADYFTSLRFNNIMCIYITTTTFVSLEYLESTFLVLGNYLIIYDTCILYNTQCSFVRNCVHIYIHF